MTDRYDARPLVLRALSTIGDLSGVDVHFADRGAVISVHERGVPFVSRLLDLTGMTVAEASSAHRNADQDVLTFQLFDQAHLHGGIEVHWFCDDGIAALTELADYRHEAVEASVAPGGGS